jgi:hypothetical protein
MEKLRKCKFKVFNKQSKEYSTLDGRFHKWGSTFEDFGENAVEVTIAIIETEDGQIWEVGPNLVQFTEGVNDGDGQPTDGDANNTAV